jgi:uncharacterized protein HemX
MAEILVALVGLLGTLIIALLGLYGARKYKIGENQDKLVATLKDIVSAQDRKIKEQDEKIQKLIKNQELLTARVEELEQLTIEQAVTIRKHHSSARQKGVANENE